MHEQKVKEIIAQLKEIRNAKGYTYQRIFDMVEESGGFVSLSTIKRVFAEGSEENHFRYEYSIRPIAIALIGADPTEPHDGETMSIAEMETNALRKIALLKEDMIQELHSENQRLQDEYATRINYLKGESEKKSAHIASLTDQINRKDRLILVLAGGFLGLLVLVCIALVVDVLHLDIGFVRGIVGRPLAIFGIFFVLLLIVAVCIVYRRIRSKDGEERRHGL